MRLTMMCWTSQVCWVLQLEVEDIDMAKPSHIGIHELWIFKMSVVVTLIASILDER